MVDRPGRCANIPDDWDDDSRGGQRAATARVARQSTDHDARQACSPSSLPRAISASAAGEAGILVDPPRPVTQLPGFAEGAFSVQDLGAQLAAPLLAIEDGMRVLDACAAPGGKTTHIAELADVDFVALDADASRVARVRENLDRLTSGEARTRIVSGDAGAPATWWDGRPFDRILADVPCTASGVARRHPDGKWLRRESDIGGFGRVQARLTRCALAMPRAWWQACSTRRARSSATKTSIRSRRSSRRHADALRETLTFAPEIAHRGGQLLPSLPGASHNQDGFFYALLRKT